MPAITAETATSHRWLLLATQLPAQPSNARVKVWRRLQQLGAIAIKNAVYVLPNSAQAMEDFTWLRTEIESAGGQATIFSASAAQDVDELEIPKQFNNARSADFEQLRRDIRDTAKAKGGAALKDVRAMRERFEQVRALDFFSAPGGSEAATALIALEEATRRDTPAASRTSESRLDPHAYQRRTWVTRPRPGIDRLSSAWLISRFIDRSPTFAFVTDPATIDDGVPFDMYGVGFAHEGAMCTFETLLARFQLKDIALRRLGELVHDLDLKDERYRVPQAAGVQAMVDGLQASIADDHALLAQGLVLFDALYRGLQRPHVMPPRTSRRRTIGGAK